MIRLQNNVPSIYVNESRDFQLLCRLVDTISFGAKFDADSILNLMNPLKASDKILELLATKVGFFTKNNIDANVLKYILSAFPYIIKNKGNRSGIVESASAIQKAESSVEVPTITVDNENYIISIYFNSDIYNEIALKDILKYIVPPGYTITFEKYETTKGEIQSNFSVKDNVQIVTTPVKYSSAVAGIISRDGTMGDIYNKSKDIVSILERFDNDLVTGYTNYDESDTASEITETVIEED